MHSTTEQRFLFLLNEWLTRTGCTLNEEQTHLYLAAALRHIAPHSDDEQILTFFKHFHSDHDLVRSLQQPLHPQHEANWQDWSMRVMLILRHRNLSWSRDSAIAEEDLAQIGRTELLASLDDFQYRSRFSTWAYHVVICAVLRCIRDQGAKKRTAPTDALPVTDEQMLMIVDDELPDLMVFSKLLYTEVAQILHDRLGPQTAQVFQLFARDDMKAAAIAARCDLHLAQVYQMIREARRVLRNHPDMLFLRERGWE